MIDNKNEEFPIVDEMGNILGAVTRGHAHDGSKILHPVVHLHVFNSQGDLYLQHRPAWKDIQPKPAYFVRMVWEMSWSAHCRAAAMSAMTKAMGRYFLNDMSFPPT